MKKPEALLCLGMATFVAWLLLCIVYPWAGFALGAVAFVALVGLLLFILVCFALARRA